MRLSPQDPQTFAMQGVVALGHYLAGRYEEAVPFAEAAFRQRSNFILAAAVVAACAARTGREADAERAILRFCEIDPGLRAGNLGDWLPFRRAEDAAHWADGLRRAGLPA
jgi:hypothetical protein